ncbi:hypothetical protein [Halomonas cerina]|uniref:Uncharacterized protein n=1 Tax=Halomonas cerina TaxID=447424 RepID=A0A839VIA3_9GAMM|nr:hypothetical protein [Halomonas cerina]MBB3192407.1 hypothetical protein [Halomonas cerina]
MRNAKTLPSARHLRSWVSIVFFSFLLSVNSVADEVATDLPDKQEDGPVQAGTPSCDDSVNVEMRRRASFKSLEGLEPARQDAIRLALIDALQNVAGADIARSTQSSTTSTRSSLERETREHLVLRSGGRVVAWEMLSEDISDSASEGGVIDVVIRAEICVEADVERPLVIALEEPGSDLGTSAMQLRYKLADALGTYDTLSIVHDLPINAYHDIKIVFDHSVDVKTVDNSAKARILQEFGATDSLSDEALKFELITARATVMAVRFFDQETISETVTRRLRRSIGLQSDDDVRDLVMETFMIAGQEIGERLGEGELAY